MKPKLNLYFICGSQDCTNRDMATIVEEALAAGVTCFQFREKGPGSLEGASKKELARKIQALCKAYEVPFLINDDIDLALELEADGIHIGQDDLPVEEARKLFPDKWIGLSISSLEEYQRSAIHLVDYIGVGPIFPTTSKDDASPAVGYELLQTLRQKAPELPIVAIGGISVETAPAVRAAGADGISVISAITKAKVISETVAALKGR